MLKKLLLLAATICGSLALASSAFALESSSTSSAEPLWVCGLSFHGEAAGLQVIVGDFETVAHGRLKCVGSKGETYNHKVRIVIGTDTIAPAVGFGDFEFVGRAAQVSLFNCGPKSLYGHYIVGEGQAAVLLGAGAFAATKVDVPQLSLEVSVELLSGFGVQAGVQNMWIQPL